MIISTTAKILVIQISLLARNSYCFTFYWWIEITPRHIVVLIDIKSLSREEVIIRPISYSWGCLWGRIIGNSLSNASVVFFEFLWNILRQILAYSIGLNGCFFYYRTNLIFEHSSLLISNDFYSLFYQNFIIFNYFRDEMSNVSNLKSTEWENKTQKLHYPKLAKSVRNQSALGHSNHHTNSCKERHSKLGTCMRNLRYQLL